MAEEPENLTLHRLRRIAADVAETGQDVRDLKERVSAVEAGLNAVRRDLVTLAEADARLQVAIDRQGERPSRIERRLDLNEGPPAAAR